jgi:hypothetical protein
MKALKRKIKTIAIYFQKMLALLLMNALAVSVLDETALAISN